MVTVRKKRKNPLGGTDLGAVGFFARNSFFRFDDFAAAYKAEGHAASAVSPILEYYSRTGHIARMRRGLYWTTAGDADPWLLGSLLGRDSIIGCDGALSFHGLTGLGHSMTIFAAAPGPELSFNEVIYRVVKRPAVNPWDGTAKHDHAGHTLRVTTLERTLVDLLEHPSWGPGLVETFNLFAAKPDLPIDLDEVVNQVRRRKSGTIAARAGIFLWGHPRWSHHLAHQHSLMELLGSQTTHIEPGRPTGKGKYIARWRTIVPHKLLDAIGKRGE